MPTPAAKNKDRAQRVLGRVAAEDFLGRAEELRLVTALAPHDAAGRGLLLLAAPAAGASELLRQAYDEMFRQRDGAVPVYFSFSPHDRTALAAARRFLHTFLVQLVAQRRHDPALVHSPPPVGELLDLVAPSDYELVERLAQGYRAAGEDGADERAFVRACFSAPQQAAARGARSVVMLDDVHLAGELAGEMRLGEEVARVSAHAGVPFVLAGLRRRLLEAVEEPDEPSPLGGGDVLRLENLSGADARSLVERLAERLRVPFNDETRDLLAQQLDGSPFFTWAVLRAAQRTSTPLTSFRDCQQVYVDELLGGRAHRRFNSLLERIAPSPVVRRSLVRALHEAASNVGGKSPVEAFRRRIDLGPGELRQVMRGLHAHELAGLNGTYVEVGASPVWRDYLRASYRLEVAAESRALVVAELLVESLKRAPRTMARHYRREASMRLGEVMRRFDFQRVPASLLRYDRFARTHKGLPADEVAAGLSAETDLVNLPQVVNTASCASFQPSMLEVCDEERCAVAHGFDRTPYADAGEVIWLAAEIESKLEVGRALAETWCDRLTRLAHACGFGRIQLWLVSPEGFSPDALELLEERGAYSSSRQQLELLSARLSAADRPDAGAGGAGDFDEYEMVIPMGEETELIAAHTVEQIARRLDFRPEEISQIKTALVEACINASEHSLSPDRKIYQRFRAENDKLIVTVSSRGLTVPVQPAPGDSLESGNGGAKGRRGWGLKLIRTLMDEVEFERADDGTRLRMTKYLRK